MWVGNVFGRVCLFVCVSVSVSVSVSVCVSVCLSVFLTVQAITFEPHDIETSFLVCRYILTDRHNRKHYLPALPTRLKFN